MKLSLAKNGYYTACVNGKNRLVHRLVAEAFLDNPNNYPCINHKNEIKTDNRVENLEWCDYRYNNTYGTHLGKSIITLKNAMSKKKIKVYSINKGGVKVLYDSIINASKYTGISSSHISECCKGTRKSAGGMKWVYADALIEELKKRK